jgi:hypothetical protein
VFVCRLPQRWSFDTRIPVTPDPILALADSEISHLNYFSDRGPFLQPEATLLKCRILLDKERRIGAKKVLNKA